MKLKREKFNNKRKIRFDESKKNFVIKLCNYLTKMLINQII